MENNADTCMEEMHIIVNRVAGAGTCGEKFDRAEARLKERGVNYSVRLTEYAGHAVALAEEAVNSGAKYVVAAGGDGTVNEVVSALNGHKEVVFGILPFGTGNDFASALGIPGDPVEAADLLVERHTSLCDLGMANDKVFTNVAGLGFDVDVLRSVEKHKRGSTGMLPYVIGILDALFHRHKIHCFVSFDGGEEEEMDALIITACNGRRFGGGMLVAPEAKPDDGMFDICIAKWVGFFRMITLLPLFVKGKHIGKKPIKYLRAKSISVRTEGGFTVETDGELLISTPLTCTLLPGAITVVRP